MLYVEGNNDEDSEMNNVASSNKTGVGDSSDTDMVMNCKTKLSGCPDECAGVLQTLPSADYSMN